MTQLQHDDYVALLGLIAEVSAAGGLDDFRRRAISALRRLVPCDLASHVEMSPGEPASRPAGAEHQIVFTLSAGRSSLVAIALGRRLRDFDERDRLLLGLARPHLVQARANAALLDHMQAAMAHDGRAVVVLDRLGRVRFTTPEAGRLLERYFGTCRGDSELPEDVRNWAERERSRHASNGGIPARARPLVAEREGRLLIARFLPRDREPRDLELGEDLVLLVEKPDHDRADLAPLGLSAREAEVLRMVARGRTDAQIADALVVSPRTVQKHLEHVYAKLGVRTRTAAVDRAFGTRAA